MTDNQQRDAAKYLYDLSKLAVTAGVVNNLLLKEPLRMSSLLIGLGVGTILFWLAFRVGK